VSAALPDGPEIETSGIARMSLEDAVAVVRSARREDEIVITTMGVSREWMRLGVAPLDFTYVPSAMGHASSLGLGLALARPDRRVIVCNGDGSMLMNLGSLVSISAAGVTNLVLIVFDNGVYEVTGAQLTPASPRARAGGAVDFAALARGAGFAVVHRFHDIGAWRRDVRAMLEARGPVFVVLDIAPVPGAVGPRSPGPAAERARTFVTALNASRG
jgi:sulfopyruvate decarboxylase subunit beta